jgi:hypothetical protein
MAYGSELGGGYGATASVIHSNASSHGFIDVADAQLLFAGHFGRTGPDLVLTGDDGRHHIIPDYFAGENHPALRAPNGASLSADLVELLAGSPAPGQYAQAQPGAASAAAAIGKVEKVSGVATVVRNGVAVALHVGDAVYQNDVIQTGSNSSVGIGFPDGTALNLVDNTRMALNEYAYDANSTSNSALFSLINGTFAFVAGKVAHTGDMKIATPVATMGIRGTTGSGHVLTPGEIAALNTVGTFTATFGDVTCSFVITDDFGVNTHGIYDLVRPDGTVALSINQPGMISYLDRDGHVVTLPMTDSQLAFESILIQELFDVLNLLNVSPRSLPGVPGSPESPTEQLPPQFSPDINNNEQPFAINLQFNTPAGPADLSGYFYFNNNNNPANNNENSNNNNGNSNNNANNDNNNNGNNNSPSPGSNIFIWNSATGIGNWDQQTNFWNVNAAPTSAIDIVEIQSGTVQYNDDYIIDVLSIDPGAILDIVGGTLAVLDSFDDGGVLIVDGDPPIFTVDGPTTVQSTGKIVARGNGSTIDLEGDVDNAGKIGARRGGTVLLGQNGTVTNELGGRIFAARHGIVTFDGTSVENAGDIAARHHGEISFNGTSVTNVFGGEITAKHHGKVSFDGSSVINEFGGLIAASDQGVIVFDESGSTATVTNVAGSDIVAEQDGSVTFIQAVITNSGATIEATDPGSEVDFKKGTVLNEGLFDGSDNLLALGMIMAENGGTVAFDKVAVTNDVDGVIEAHGSGSQVDFNDGSVVNDGVILAGDFGEVAFDTVDVTNDGGTIKAAHHGIVTFEDGQITNEDGGKIEARHHGKVSFDDTNVTNDDSTIKAAHHGIVTFEDGQITNEDGGKIEARHHGKVSFDNTNVTNDDSTIEAADHSFIGFYQGAITNENDAKIEARNDSTVAFADTTVTNDGGTIEAIGSGSFVDLADATVIGGTVGSRDGGIIQTVFGRNTLENVTISDGSEIRADFFTSLALVGLTTIDGTVTFEGLGLFTLGAASDQIVGAGAGSTLVNDGFILGVGKIGDGNSAADALTLDNSGTIEALRGELVIDTGIGPHSSATTVNDGLLDAFGPKAVLLIEQTTIDNTGGTIAAFDSRFTLPSIASQVDLEGVRITGGTLETTGRGTIQILDSAFGASTFDDLTNDGVVIVDAGATLTLDGTIHNDGLILVDSAISGADLQIDGTVKLEGYGTVELDGDQDQITAASHGAVLENFSTITGYGEIGDGNQALTLDNECNGTIDANVRDRTLTIDTGSKTITNAGLMEATRGGALVIDSDVDNAWGVIAAYGFDSTVQLSGVEITHGELDSALGGEIEILSDGGTATTFDDLTNRAFVVVDAGATLALDGTIHNDGLILVDSPNAGADLQIDGTVKLEGYGTVELDGNHDQITAASHGAVLENFSTITGYGEIGAGDKALTLDNECNGTIDANVRDRTLTVDTGSKTITNAGLMEATRGGTLVIDSDVDNAWGVIAAYGAGSVVELFNVTIAGGVLATSDPYFHDKGVIEVGTAGGQNESVFDGSQDQVTVEGYVQVDPGATLELKGAIDNNGGTIALDQRGSGVHLVGSDLAIDGTVTLTGPGAVVLEGNATAITGTGHNAELDNYSWILGSGKIGVGDSALTFVNEIGGTVEAEGGALGPVVIDTGHNTVVNAGTLEASIGSTLAILSDVDNNGGTIEAVDGGTVTLDPTTIDNTDDGHNDGTIAANGAGSTVFLYDGTEIIGGTLSTSSDGLIEVANATGDSNSNATFDGSQTQCDTVLPLTNDGDVQVDNDTSLTLLGTIINDGTIDLRTGNAGATLKIDGTVSLEGNGVVTLDGAVDTIVGIGHGGNSSATLDNFSTISGTGTIGHHGNGDLTLDNEACGVIDAVGTLVLDTGNTIGNAGLLEVSSGGVLDVDDSKIDNTGADPLGANPTGILVEGTLQVDASTLMLTGGGALDLDGGAIKGHGVAEDEIYILDNVDNTISGFGTIGHNADGKLELQNDCNGTVDANVVGKKLTIDTGNTITNNGILEADGGKLVIDDNVIGCGHSVISHSGTLEIVGTDAQNVVFDDASTLKLDNPSGFSGQISGLGEGDTIDLAGTCPGSVFWDGSGVLVNGVAATFTIAGLPAGDTFGVTSDGHGGTDLVVLTQALTVAPTAVSGTEGSPILLNLGISLASAGDSLTSVTISDIPANATLSDTNGATLTIVSGSITLNGTELAAGDLNGLSITPANDANFNLGVTVTATDGNGNTYDAVATEGVTVGPTAPTVSSTTVTGTEGQPIALDLASAISPSGASGDSNSIDGVTLTFTVAAGDTYTFSSADAGLDQTFTAGADQTLTLTQAEIASDVLNDLSITTANAANASLAISATEQDADGESSSTAATGTLSVTVDPTAPTVSSTTVTGTEGQPIALDLASAISPSGASGDSNSIDGVTLTFTVADGDTYTFSSVDAGLDQTFTAGAGQTLTLTQAEIAAGVLNDLSITTVNANSASLTISATQQDSDGNVSATAGSGTETVTALGATTITFANALGAVTEDASYVGNLIVNGGFENYSYNDETGVYTIPDWTFGGNFFYPPGEGSPAHSGGGALDVYNYIDGIGTASETFATDIGQTYEVTFYVYKADGATNSLSALWDGTTEVSLVDYAQFGNYHEYQFSAVATQSTSTLQFDFDSGAADYWYLDDVSAVPIGPNQNPDPGTELRTGTITFADTEAADTHKVSVTPEGTGYLGNFVADLTQDSTGGDPGNVTWNFTVSDAALASLAPGQVVTQNYDVIITGTDEAPVEQTVTVQLVGIAVPTGFIFTPDASGLDQLQDGGMLNSGGGGSIGNFVQSGGPAGDSYSFSIGGASLSHFSPDGYVDNIEYLYTNDTHTVPGGNPADVYALTVTVTDTTTGAVTGALPFDVVVGNSSANFINLETGSNNLGIAATTPTIVYGLSGSDTINATGMTASVWIAGGPNADTMTGGSGQTSYLFTRGDSSVGFSGSGTTGNVSGFDVVTNFTPGQTVLSSQIDYDSVVVGTTAVSRNHSNLEVHTGGTVTSDSITNGMVSFNDSHSNTAVALTSTGDVAAAVQFLLDNDNGTTGTALAFVATINGVSNTYVFIQGSNSGGSSSGSSDVVIDLQNTVATSLSAANDLLSVLDTSTPGIASIATSGSGISGGSGAVDAGKTVTFTVTMSENVAVTGTPIIALNDGGTATYQSGSGTNALVFTYTVAAGDTASDLALTSSGISLNGGTIQDLAGNTANLSAAVNYTPGGTLVVDTTAPVVAKTGFNGHTVSGTDSDVGGSGVASVHVTDSTHSASGNATLNGGNWTYTNSAIQSGDNLTILATDAAGNQTTKTSTAPAGTAGSPINLGLSNLAPTSGTPIALTISGVPAGWSLNEGEDLGNGTWAVTAEDLTQLTVMTAAAYAGAMVLNVTETWTNADGSAGQAYVSDNVEAYASGSPVFALAGDDNLTGTGGHDLFVLAQPIGSDIINNFNVASDKIDLVSFADVASFSDLRVADDANGNAVITVGNDETITLHGVNAASLNANDFVFNQTPVVDNAGVMTISDEALLPLGGTVDNTGTIALNSTGDQTELQIVGDGVTLEGGGQITLSGDSLIVGTTPATTLTNVDNTISGAGQIGVGDGSLTLVNEALGRIEANVAGGTLTLDTGHTIANAGVLEASNGGTLLIDDAVSSSGGGHAVIAGGTLEFAAASNADVAFDNGASGTGYGTLVLDDASAFSGQISGFSGTAWDSGHSDAIDLNGFDFASTTFTETGSNNNLMLTVTNGADAATLTFDNVDGALSFAADGDGGTLITDSSAGAAATANGMISLAGSGPAGSYSESVSPEGSGYIGSFSLDPAKASDGHASVGWEFNLGNDQINLGSGQTVTQSYAVSVADPQNPAANTSQTVSISLGGSGSDNFTFHPGVGADTIVNFNPQADTIELDHFASVQTAQQLASAITSDAHGDAVIDLGNHDSITLPGVTATHLQQIAQSVVHLH